MEIVCIAWVGEEKRKGAMDKEKEHRRGKSPQGRKKGDASPFRQNPRKVLLGEKGELC